MLFKLYLILILEINCPLCCMNWYSWDLIRSSLAFFQKFFKGEGKIYCYADFFCYSNFPIVFGLNFRGAKVSEVGKLFEGAPLPPVEESQVRNISLYTFASYSHSCKILQSYVVAMVRMHSDAIFPLSVLLE